MPGPRSRGNSDPQLVQIIYTVPNLLPTDVLRVLSAGLKSTTLENLTQGVAAYGRKASMLESSWMTMCSNAIRSVQGLDRGKSWQLNAVSGLISSDPSRQYFTFANGVV